MAIHPVVFSGFDPYRAVRASSRPGSVRPDHERSSAHADLDRSARHEHSSQRARSARDPLTRVPGAPAPVPPTSPAPTPHGSDDALATALGRADRLGVTFGEAAPFWWDLRRGAPDVADERGAPVRRRGEGVREAADVLGVDVGASPQQVDDRFRTLVKARRPDLGRMDADDLRGLAEARRTLSEAGRRARAEQVAALWEIAEFESRPPAPELDARL